MNELELTRLAREGRLNTPRVEAAEHIMRMPLEDFLALCRLYPELKAADPVESSKALDRLFNSPLAEKYRVARTANQVQRAPRCRGILKAG